MNSPSIVSQLEEFKAFIESTNPTVVSNIEMRRKYYSEHPAEAKKSDLCDTTVDIFKNIVIAFIQLNNANANQTIASVNTLLQNNLKSNNGSNGSTSTTTPISKTMWDELIVKITNSIKSSNLTISNTKENHAKLISVIEKYNAGFIQAFITYQLSMPFSIEILDCLMYTYMNYKDIEESLMVYMQTGGKYTFTELLKFINISVNDFKELYFKYIKTVTDMTGYMKYVNDEILEVINK